MMEGYKNQQLPVEARIEDLLSKMTLQEKLGQLNQRMLGWNAYNRTEEGYELTENFRDEVAFGDGLGALYGLFRADPWSKVTERNGIAPLDSAKVANLVQRYVVEHTRLGIPILLSEECPHGHQSLGGTMFPVNIGIGSSWNTDLYKQAYACVAAEIRSRGGHLGLVSTLDIVRDPRWGRTEECFGEDPYLSARMTEAAVRGLQGLSRSELAGDNKVAACLKHFAAQGACTGGHNAWPAAIGERELREIHLPPMKAGAEAGALACMAAYNEIDGIPCHANDKLLTGILRDELGFEGLVMSDGCGVDAMAGQMGSLEHAGAAAVRAGVDLNLWNDAFLELGSALANGTVTLAAIDQAVRRVLRVKFELGLFENPYTDERLAEERLSNAFTAALNRELARESIVLLKNEGSILPLSKSLRTIAVIGPNADNLYNQLGDYTPTRSESEGVTVLQGIQAALGAGTTVLHAQGCGIRDASKDGFPEALRVAEQADAVILVLGGSSARNFDIQFGDNGAAIVSEDLPAEMDCGEGVDVADLALGGVQEELAQALLATGKPVVAVLIQGRPHAITKLSETCQAILCVWYPGAEGGSAIADVVFGDVSPSGKLSVSVPRSSAQLPVYYNFKGRTTPSAYADMPGNAQYPFGFGLSYTTFQYANMRARTQVPSLSELEQGSLLEVDVDVTNTGDRRGKEVVQLYMRATRSSVTRRSKELKAFAKIDLEPGQSSTVTFRLGREELGIWNSRMRFVVEEGVVELFTGADSATLSELSLQVGIR